MLDKAIHRQIMFNILKDIFSLDRAKYIALKWGTACYFLYGLERFSTDLDFDLLKDIEVDDDFTKILQKYWTLKKWQKMILSYEDEGDNIKIDINRHIWENNVYEVVNFFGTDIQVQDRKTICTNKLVALTQRHTNRDIYDARFFLKNNFGINVDLIQERTWKSQKYLFEKILKKLQTLWASYKILDGMGSLIDEKQKSFVKNSLMNELIGMIKMRLQFGE